MRRRLAKAREQSHRSDPRVRVHLDSIRASQSSLTRMRLNWSIRESFGHWARPNLTRNRTNYGRTTAMREGVMKKSLFSHCGLATLVTLLGWSLVTAAWGKDSRSEGPASPVTRYGAKTF